MKSASVRSALMNLLTPGGTVASGKRFAGAGKLPAVFDLAASAATPAASRTKKTETSQRKKAAPAAPQLPHPHPQAGAIADEDLRPEAAAAIPWFPVTATPSAGAPSSKSSASAATIDITQPVAAIRVGKSASSASSPLAAVATQYRQAQSAVRRPTTPPVALRAPQSQDSPPMPLAATGGIEIPPAMRTVGDRPRAASHVEPKALRQAAAQYQAVRASSPVAATQTEAKKVESKAGEGKPAASTASHGRPARPQESPAPADGAGSAVRVESSTGSYEVAAGGVVRRIATAATVTSRVGEKAGSGTGVEAALPTTVPQTLTGLEAAGFDASGTVEPLPADLARTIEPTPLGRQVIEGLSAAAEGSRQVVVRLDPPELGSVTLKLESRGGELRAVVEVDNARTLAEIQKETPALVQRLTDGGIQVRSLDLVMTGGSPDSSQSQMFWQDRQGWGQGAERGFDHGTYAAMSGGDATGSVSQTSLVADNAINVWV